jgi:hypothetical protein
VPSLDTFYNVVQLQPKSFWAVSHGCFCALENAHALPPTKSALLRTSLLLVYHISPVDDSATNITHIIRGEGFPSSQTESPRPLT